MNAAAGLLIALAVLIVTTLVGDLASQEVHTRLERLPRALVRLILRAAPVQQRASVREECEAELSYIWHQTDGLPVTRLWRGMLFAVGLVLSVPRWEEGRTRLGDVARLLTATGGLAMIGYPVFAVAYFHEWSETWQAVVWAIHPLPQGDSELKNVRDAIAMLDMLASNLGTVMAGVGAVLAALNPQARWRQAPSWDRVLRVGRAALVWMMACLAIWLTMSFTSPRWPSALLLAVPVLFLAALLNPGRRAVARMLAPVESDRMPVTGDISP